jgi:hypothetical protein
MRHSQQITTLPNMQKDRRPIDPALVATKEPIRLAAKRGERRDAGSPLHPEVHEWPHRRIQGQPLARGYVESGSIGADRRLSDQWIRTALTSSKSKGTWV